MRLRRGESGEGTSFGQNLGHAMENEKRAGSAGGRLDELRQGESGQTTVIMTLFLATFLLGFIAVGIDVASLFAAKRQAQAAADAAAIAAAEESPNFTNEQTAAWAVAALNGFDHLAAVNPAIVTPGPVVGGNYDGDTGSVQVVVSRPIRTFFAGILTHNATMVVAARAVAKRGMTSPTCVCLENPTGTDLDLSNGAKFSPNGCGTTVNSSSSNAVSDQGGATLGGQSIGSVSSNWYPNGVFNGGNLDTAKTTVVQNLSSGCSPPVPVAPAYDSTKCTGDPLSVGNTDGKGYSQGGSAYSVGPGSGNGKDQNTGTLICYTALTLGSNNDSVTLKDGTYVIANGTLHFLSGTTYGGNSITFYLTGTAKLIIDNGANMNLNAPISGDYAGIVVLQDSGDSTLTVPRLADSQPMTIAGGANTSFNGGIFAPTSKVTLSNGSNTNINADLVASTLTMNGGTNLTSKPTISFGTFNISTAKLTE